MRLTTLSALAVLTAATSAVAAPRQHKTHKGRPAAQSVGAVRPAVPKAGNQYITVDEFVRSGLPAHTAVSVEGFIVFASRTPDGGAHISLVDDVSRVLNPRDAEGQARSGASATISGSAVLRRPTLGCSPKGVLRFAMYTGAGTPQRQLHDAPSKVRLTGWSGGRGNISSVTRVEFQDENGDWKTL